MQFTTSILSALALAAPLATALTGNAYVFNSAADSIGLCEEHVSVRSLPLPYRPLLTPFPGFRYRHRTWAKVRRQRVMRQERQTHIHIS